MSVLLPMKENYLTNKQTSYDSGNYRLRMKSLLCQGTSGPRHGSVYRSSIPARFYRVAERLKPASLEQPCNGPMCAPLLSQPFPPFQGRLINQLTVPYISPWSCRHQWCKWGAGATVLLSPEGQGSLGPGYRRMAWHQKSSAPIRWHLGKSRERSGENDMWSIRWVFIMENLWENDEQEKFHTVAPHITLVGEPPAQNGLQCHPLDRYLGKANKSRITTRAGNKLSFC